MKLALKAATFIVALLIGMALAVGATPTLDAKVGSTRSDISDRVGDDAPKTVDGIRVPTRIDVGR